MPGSQTAPGRTVLALGSRRSVSPSDTGTSSAPGIASFAAQRLAYASPYRRFAADLAIDSARLGADAVRYTFIVEDFHLLLLAGLPAHPVRSNKSPCSLKQIPC